MESNDNVHFFNLETSPETQTIKSKRKYFLASIVLLLVVALTFGVLFGVFYEKYKDGYDRTEATEASPQVCLSPDCVATASYLYSVMDFKADPCQDFSQYVCGQKVKDIVIPHTQSKVNVFDEITLKNNQFFRGLLEKPIGVNDMDYLQKMKDYYASCIDTETIEKIGLTPYSESSWFDDWPTLNPAWDKSTFDLKATVQRYEREFAHNLFRYEPREDDTNSSRKIIWIRQPYLCLSVNEMRGARNSSAILACEQYYFDLAVALKGNATVARDDAKAVIDFQVQLAKIFVRHEDINNNSEFINRFTLRRMNTVYPEIDWVGTFEAIFKRSGMDFDPEMIVNVEFPRYVESLSKILSNVDPRVLQNLYAFDLANGRLRMLTVAMRTADLEYRKHRSGVNEDTPRWRQCVDEVGRKFGAGLSKQFVNMFFSQESKDFVTRMVLLVKETMKEQIEAASWMEDKTRKAALHKLKMMKVGVGFPDKHFQENDINDIYKHVKVNKSNFYQTRLELATWSQIKDLRALKETPNNYDWSDKARYVTGFNRIEANTMDLLAGILQPPIYSANFPSSLNYGALGNVIGHMMTHAFDLRGSQYDERGTLRNWWTAGDRQKFLNRTQCLIDQYSNFFIKEVGLYANGRRLVTENVGDTDGDITAYKAYKKFAATQPKELPLPGLGLTTDQQMFVGIGQVHCAKYRKEELRRLVLGARFATGFLRINGPLQNNEDFAKAFDCPVGSPMNPKQKCVIW